MPAPDTAWKRCWGVLRPIAAYIQMKATDSVKEELGNMLAANPQVIGQLCEGIIFSFIKNGRSIIAIDGKG